MLNRRKALSAAIGLIAAGGAVQRARAQTVDKVVHIIVGFPAGGGTDVVARILAKLSAAPMPRPSSSKTRRAPAARIGVEYVKNAEADGSVMLFTPDFPITLYSYSFKSLNYDPVHDFIPAAPVTKSMLTYIIGPAVPESVKTLGAFVQWAKANPATAMYATTAAGDTPHFTGVMLAQAAGIPMTPVHYRGGAPALQDLIGGHVPASVNPISETLPFANSGKEYEFWR